MTRKLVLNLAPVAFDDKNVRVEFFPYSDQDHLRSLRTTHRDTHFVQRYRSEQVIAVPTVANAPSLGGTAGEVRLHGDLGLCAALLRNSLLSCLHGRGNTVVWFDPVEFVSQSEELLGPALADPTSRPAWLEVRPKYEISVRRAQFDIRRRGISRPATVRLRQSNIRAIYFAAECPRTRETVIYVLTVMVKKRQRFTRHDIETFRCGRENVLRTLRADAVLRGSRPRPN